MSTCFRYDEDLAQQDPIAFDPKNKLGPGAMARGMREQKGRPSPATWKWTFRDYEVLFYECG